MNDQVSMAYICCDAFGDVDSSAETLSTHHARVCDAVRGSDSLRKEQSHDSNADPRMGTVKVCDAT